MLKDTGLLNFSYAVDVQASYNVFKVISSTKRSSTPATRCVHVRLRTLLRSGRPTATQCNIRFLKLIDACNTRVRQLMLEHSELIFIDKTYNDSGM